MVHPPVRPQRPKTIRSVRGCVPCRGQLPTDAGRAVGGAPGGGESRAGGSRGFGRLGDFGKIRPRTAALLNSSANNGAQRGGATKGLAPGTPCPRDPAAESCYAVRRAKARPENQRSPPVNRALALALGTALCDAPIALAGFTAAAAPAGAWKAPLAADGHPALSRFWPNATLTPEQRPAKLGDRQVYTPAEVKALEAAVVEEVKEGNAPTDPNAPAAAPPPAKNIRPEFAAAGGDVGGYNRGWLDPG